MSKESRERENEAVITDIPEPSFTKGMAVVSNSTNKYPFGRNYGGYIEEFNQRELFRPLFIEPEKFIEMYNLDIEDFVERHTFREKAQSKGGSDLPVIKYMSYSHAVKLFRQNFPGYEVCCVINPQTGGYVFKEVDDRGYFILAYIQNGTERSEKFYFAVLSTSGSTVYPNDKDRNGNYVANGQLFNKSIYRALTKVIALVTGIGLKLWTGDDLGEQILDGKLTMIAKIRELADKYLMKFGVPYVLPNLDYTTSETEVKRIGKELLAALKNDKINQSSIEAAPTQEVAVQVQQVTEPVAIPEVTILEDA